MFQKHPIYISEKQKYTFIKPAKTSAEKSQNKKNKQLFQKDVSLLRNYLIDSNNFMIIMILILLFIQTSIPPYINLTKNIQLLKDFYILT